MAPHRPLQTYSRSNSSVNYGRSYVALRRSEDVFNSLMAKNLTKRRIIQHKRKRVNVKELSLNKSTKLTDDSLEVNLEDTFDKLARDNVVNPVPLKRCPVRNTSSESEYSRSQLEMAHVQIKVSPVKTRSRKKKRKLVPPKKLDTDSIIDISEIRKETTLDKSISVSLIVEKENGKLDYRTLSYIRIPEVLSQAGKTELQISVESLDKSSNLYHVPFKDLPVSSTPLVQRKPKKIITHQFSTTPNLIQPSLDEINKWDFSLPSAIIPESGDNEQANKSASIKQSYNTRSSKKLNFVNESLDNFKGFTNAVISVHDDESLMNSNSSIIPKSGDNEQINKSASVKQSYNTRSSKKLHFENESSANSNLRGFTNAGISVQDGESLRNSKRLSKSAKQHRPLSTNNTVEINDCKVVLNQINLSQMDSPKSPKKLLTLSQCDSVNPIQEPYELSELSNINSSNKGYYVDSSSSHSSNSSRSHYENLDSVYINLRKRKVYSKHFHSRNRSTPVPIIDDVSSIEEPLHKQNSTKYISRQSIDVSNQHFSNSDIIPPTPLKNSEFQSACKQLTECSSVTAACQNPYKCLTNDDAIQVNLCGDTLETSDIIPATPGVSRTQSHFTLNKSNTYYYRPLAESLHIKGDIGDDTDIEASAARSNLTYHTTQRSSLPVNSRSHYSIQSEEESNAYINIDNNKPYILLHRMSLPECSKLTENCDNLVSSPSSGSLSDINSVSQNRGVVFNAKPAIVRLKKLPSDICINIEHGVKPVVELERFKYVPSNKDTLNIKTNTTSSLISINDSSVITVDSSVNRDAYDDCEQKPPKICTGNPVVNVTDILATPVSAIAKTGHDPSYIFNGSKIPANSTPYSCHKSKQIHGGDLSDVAEDSGASSRNESNKTDVECKGIFVAPKPQVLVKPGKSWRRSLASVKRQSILGQSMEKSHLGSHICSASSSVERKLSKRLSVKIVPITPLKSKLRESTILETYALCKSGYVPEQEPVVDDRLLEASIRSIRELSLNVTGQQKQDSLIENSTPLLTLTARDVVLRRCGQTEPLCFRECYTSSCLEHCQKIGEGVYGEVFLYRNKNGGTTVMKVIPIEGNRIVNGERQKKFDEILSEIVIAMELSNLRNNEDNRTTAFSEVIDVKCVQGCYPEKLLELWDLYDEVRQSDNDSPTIFTEEQLYIILELANGGKDIEAFFFTNAAQAYSVFQQTACALAIAENELKFEHRDLHWGNILVSVVDRNKKLGFLLNGDDIQVGTKGVEVAIIDFTLSRIMYDGCVIFNDLAEDDDLFTAKGDYQFEIYRQMQKRNGNEWQHFEPYTNVLWLHYLLDKMVTGLRYKNPQTKVHKEYIEKLKKFKNEVLSYRSVEELVNKIFL